MTNNSEKGPSAPPRPRSFQVCLPLDAKRKPAKQEGFEGWYPYYAGYTEDFARRVLRQLSAETMMTVLDPWNGSGTTTTVAHGLGHRAIGFDLNPVATLVASAKLAHPGDALHVAGLARRLSCVRPSAIDSGDPLLPWMAPSVVSQYRSIERGILSELATTSQGVAASAKSGTVPPLAAFLLLALIRAAKDAACVHRGTNPTWTIPGGGRRPSVRKLGEKWLACMENMSHELAAVHRRTFSAPCSCAVSIGDSRTLRLPDAEVDLVLTSPPYCTRIDYVVSASFELAALGVSRDSQEFEALRRASMGTPLAQQGPPPEIPSKWPRGLRDLLSAIRAHPSKASRSYYYKTFYQYFADAWTSLAELWRVLKPQGKAIFVLQTSYYKELCVDLPRIYSEIAEGLGFRGEIAGEAAVPRTLAQIHPHSHHHRKPSQYREAVVVLEKVA